MCPMCLCVAKKNFNLTMSFLTRYYIDYYSRLRIKVPLPLSGDTFILRRNSTFLFKKDVALQSL